MSRPGVVWVSTSLDTHGGVATFVRTMRDTPLWDRWQVRHVATHRNGTVARRAVAFLTGSARLLFELVVRRPLLVHVHTASYGSFVRKSLLCWSARLAGVPVVIHVHGAEFHRFFERCPHPAQRYVRVTLEGARAVVALGPTWAHRLQTMAPAARVVVVPNAVPLADRSPQPGTGRPVQVLFLGEVSDRKGAFVLLRAWQRLHASAAADLPARLVLAGDGAVVEARSWVRHHGLDATVTVLGWVDRRRVERLLAESQVLVLASRDEGQPMAVLEAMAHGLCVVVTPVGGLPDLVGDDCSVLVPVDDEPALASALHRVLTDPALRARLGAAAHARVRERFDVARTWQTLDALYAEVGR